MSGDSFCKTAQHSFLDNTKAVESKDKSVLAEKKSFLHKRLGKKAIEIKISINKTAKRMKSKETTNLRLSDAFILCEH